MGWENECDINLGTGSRLCVEANTTDYILYTPRKWHGWCHVLETPCMCQFQANHFSSQKQGKRFSSCGIFKWVPIFLLFLDWSHICFQNYCKVGIVQTQNQATIYSVNRKETADVSAKLYLHFLVVWVDYVSGFYFCYYFGLSLLLHWNRCCTPHLWFVTWKWKNG